MIRPGTAADVGDLARLRAAWHGGDADPAFLQRFSTWWDAVGTRRLWWVASLEGAVVGMVNVQLFDRMPSPERPATQWGYVGNAFVEEHARGRGLGTALMEAVLADARERRLARVVLSPSERARPLYARVGFRAADELLVWTP